MTQQKHSSSIMLKPALGYVTYNHDFDAHFDEYCEYQVWSIICDQDFDYEDPIDPYDCHICGNRSNGKQCDC